MPKKRSKSSANVPSRRSKRLRNEPEQWDDLNSEDAVERPQNTKGLALFPDELYLEILSKFSAPSETIGSEDALVDADLQAVRREALLALSQTCHNMRRFFRPYIWNRIEVLTGMRIGKKILGKAYTQVVAQKLAAELVRQLEIVTIRDPTLAKDVKIVNVEIRNYSTDAVLAELARCMVLFGNLHTVKLQFGLYNAPNDCVLKAFESRTYPQIRSVLLPLSGSPFLRHCPGLVSFQSLDTSLNGRRAAFWMPDLMHCHLLESASFTFDVFTLYDASIKLPNLRELSINIPMPLFLHTRFFTDAMSMSNFTRLQKITLEMSSDDSKSVTAARKLLLDLQRKDKEVKYLSIKRVPQYQVQGVPMPCHSELITLEVPKSLLQSDSSRT